MAVYPIPANTTAYGQLLSKDYDKIFKDNYAKFGKMWASIANISTSNANYIKEGQISDLTALRDIGQGEQVQYESPIQGNEKTVYFDKMGLGFQITEEMSADDLTGIMRQMPAALGRAAAYTFEYKFWDIFNSGFGTNIRSGIDGAALFASHSLIGANGGTYSNYASSAAALAMTTLQAMLDRGINTVDESNRPAPIYYNLLIIPNALRWLAAKLLLNEYDPSVDLTNGSFMAKNPIKMEAKGLSYMTVPYLTSSTAFFMVDKSMHDLRFVWRKKLTPESSSDFNTGNGLWKVTTRFKPTFFHWRGVDGNAGA